MENTNPMTMMEKVTFKTMLPTGRRPIRSAPAFIGNEDTMRLACCTEVMGDMTVETKPAMNLTGENFFS